LPGVVFLAIGVVACGSAPPSTAPPRSFWQRNVGRAPAPSTPPVAPVPVSTAATAAPATAPSATGASDPGDACNVGDELGRAFQAIDPPEKEAAWVRTAREKLLSPEDAPRALAGIAQEILSALAHRRYDKLAAFSSQEGICMRAAKGAPCQMLTRQKLAGCAASGIKMDWPVGEGGGEAPRYSCGEAFKRVFYARDFLHAKAAFNCFPPSGRGNNPAPVVLSAPRLGYVEASIEDAGGFRSLWLVFDGAPTAPELVEMIADYPRP
jgi:hypothetical protein